MKIDYLDRYPIEKELEKIKLNLGCNLITGEAPCEIEVRDNLISIVDALLLILENID